MAARQLLETNPCRRVFEGMEFMKIKTGVRKYVKLATLVVAFLMLFISLDALLCLLPPPSPNPSATPVYLKNAGFDSRLAWYFESGQWRADARTLVAAVKYLVTPEPSSVTNPPSRDAANRASIGTG